MSHSPGTWRYNPDRGEILSDQPVHDEDDSLQHGYEGYVVAETVTWRNGPFLATAPAMLAALRSMNQVLGSEDPCLKHNEWPCESCLVGPQPGDLRTLRDILQPALAAAEGRDA